MRQASEVSIAVQQIDRDVQELQLRVSRYMATGHDSLRNDIVRLNDRLVSHIESQASTQTNQQMKDLFVRMSEHLPEYKMHFDSVIEERGLRADLVQKQLPAQSAVIQEHFRALDAVIPGNDQFVLEHAAVLRWETQFSQAEKLLLRYYVAADAAFVDQALEHMLEVKDSLSSLNTTPDVEVQKLRLLEELNQYQRLGIRAVQATRSYLFLVNVVLAGEASEVSYFSDLLRTLAQESSQTISTEMAATVASTQQFTRLGILLAVMLGVLFAGQLGRSILNPVTAITETLRQLASGQTAVAIPGTQRKDEIGQMALAAEVFRQRNVEQEQLLRTSEALTKELAAKAEELEATNKDLDNFAYVASHDLKSPLRGIRQLAAWIDEDAGHLLPEESVQHCRKMQERVERMELLLDDLLNFSRIGRSEAQAEIVDVSELVTGIAEITNNPYSIEINITRELPTLCTLRFPLEQVLLNLISNAIKYNDKRERGVVELTWEQERQNYIFTIRDNGPGIAAEHHERVFQMYQRVGDPAIAGSGMGLAIVKKQVERIGGSIQLLSGRDEGTAFIVTWPVTQTQTEIRKLQHV